MKHLLAVSALAIATLSSCGGSSKNGENAQDQDSTAVVDNSVGKYINEKYGFSISYLTDVFELDKDAQTEDGVTLAGIDGQGQLRVFKGNLDATINGGTNLKEAYNKDIEPKGKREVTYKAFNSTNYVLMGYEGKVIFYQKSIISKGEIVTAILTYESKAKDTYYPLIEPIFKSLK